MTVAALERGLAAIASLDRPERRCVRCRGQIHHNTRAGAVMCTSCAKDARRRARRRGLLPECIEAGAGPRLFPFDAIVARFPLPQREAKVGTIDGGWQDEMAARLTAAYPRMTHNGARQRVLRARGTMLHAYLADAYAVALGVHPVEIWPDWFEKAV